ncbi:hypothetical protein HDU93_009893, partial [Gonapodya sp. JEL0774]
MSNRSRQNVASFFLHSVPVQAKGASTSRPNWVVAAELFESLLIDHDPHSNYGNWQYLAGVGTDPRGWRKFNMIKQASEYDPMSRYVCEWIPELRKLRDQWEGEVPNGRTDGLAERLQKPWTVDGGHAITAVGYPHPIATEK